MEVLKLFVVVLHASDRATLLIHLPHHWDQLKYCKESEQCAKSICGIHVKATKHCIFGDYVILTLFCKPENSPSITSYHNDLVKEAAEKEVEKNCMVFIADAVIHKCAMVVKTFYTLATGHAMDTCT